MHPLDRLLNRGDRGPGEQVMDRYRQRQSGALPPPRTGRLLRNSRQQAAYEQAERERLARRRRSDNL
jgi:hypothetical protein